MIVLLSLNSYGMACLYSRIVLISSTHHRIQVLSIQISSFTLDAKAFSLHSNEYYTVSICTHCGGFDDATELLAQFVCIVTHSTHRLQELTLLRPKQPHRRMIRVFCFFFCCWCPHSVNFLNGSAVVCELVANQVATAVLFLILSQFLNLELVVVHFYPHNSYIYIYYISSFITKTQKFYSKFRIINIGFRAN